MPWVKLEQSDSPPASRPDQNGSGGLSYFLQGQNINVKAGYGVIDPKVGKRLHLFTVQVQIFYSERGE